MTPLATELVEDLYSKIYFRPLTEIDGRRDQRFLRSVLWTCAHQCKFFDCAAVTQLALHLAAQLYDTYEQRDLVDQRRAFLPAQWTWIEMENPGFCDADGNEDANFVEAPFNKLIETDLECKYMYRTAIVLMADNVTVGPAKRLQLGYETPRRAGAARIWRVTELTPLPLVNSGIRPERFLEYHTHNGTIEHFDKPTAYLGDFICYALLALINSPRVIGQRLHYPHQRLEREKLAKLGLVGKFPLRAWTEILLTVGLPEDRSGQPPEEAHLTGERCLHYCRTYMRVRNGMIEYVDGHWRGNPALGIKRSRYMLAG